MASPSGLSYASQKRSSSLTAGLDLLLEALGDNLEPLDAVPLKRSRNDVDISRLSLSSRSPSSSPPSSPTDNSSLHLSSSAPTPILFSRSSVPASAPLPIPNASASPLSLSPLSLVGSPSLSSSVPTDFMPSFFSAKPSGKPSARASDAEPLRSSAPISSSVPTSSPSAEPLLNRVLSIPSPLTFTRFGSSSSSRSPFSLQVVRQPPAKAVYKRILKPWPAVLLAYDPPAKSSYDDKYLSNLFVEAVLIRSDTEELMPFLDGNRMAKVSTRAPAVFSKLKILSTSAMASCTFRLKFVLKHFTGSSFETVEDACALSSAVEVFSHTLYLQSDTPSKSSERHQQEQPSVPTVTEVLPKWGSQKGGSRVAILGHGFKNTGNLCVKFGTTVVPGEFHEECCVLVNTPSSAQPQMVPVTISLDGVHFSPVTPSIFFIFTPAINK